MKRRFFGTNGIRGVPGKDLSLEFILEMSSAIAQHLRRGPLLVGYDGRASSPSLCDAVVAGLLSAGMEVGEAGLLPTPALQYAIKGLGYAGGIMVTASHNPPEYNGIKVLGPDGIEVSREEELAIEQIYLSRSYSKADWKGLGSSFKEGRALAHYIRGVSESVDAEAIASKGYTMVMDPGNGAQSVAAPYIMERLGCRVVTLHANIDPKFGGRGAEPTPESLAGMASLVKAQGAQLGVGYDGDGDRSIFCDERGIVHWGDKSGALIAQHILKARPGALIVTTVSTSQLIDDIAEKYSGRVLRTKVGSVEVSHAMKEHDAIFGFEENGGCLYAPHLCARDGGMSTALMLEVMAKAGRPLSQLMDELPSYYQRKERVHCPQELVGEVMSRVEGECKGMKKVDKTDGIKAWLDEGTWVLVRPSGTEPLIRIFGESYSEARLDDAMRRFLDLVQEVVSKGGASLS